MQARITLARAIYSKAHTLLLDDVSYPDIVSRWQVLNVRSYQVLAALDVHTSKWIVDKCFKGDLVRGRTVLLVVSLSVPPRHLEDRSSPRIQQTHNVSMASPIADFVVALGTDGRVISQGSIASALEHDKKLAAEVVLQAIQKCTVAEVCFSFNHR